MPKPWITAQKRDGLVGMREQAGQSEVPGRLVGGDVPGVAAGLAVERAQQRPRLRAVAALEDAAALAAGQHAAVRGRQARELGEPQLALLAVAEAFARELPGLAQVGAPPDARAVPLAGRGGVERARDRVVHGVVHRPALAERPAHVPRAAGRHRSPARSSPCASPPAPSSAASLLPPLSASRQSRPARPARTHRVGTLGGMTVTLGSRHDLTLEAFRARRLGGRAGRARAGGRAAHRRRAGGVRRAARGRESRRSTASRAASATARRCA